jgi:hypothetical protein
MACLVKCRVAGDFIKDEPEVFYVLYIHTYSTLQFAVDREFVDQ